MRGTDLITVALGSDSVVALLNRFVLQVIHLEEIKGSLVSTINQHSQLQVIELIVLDGLNA